MGEGWFWPQLKIIWLLIISMSGSAGTRGEYTWTNREAYSNHGVQQLGDKLTTRQSEEQQRQNTQRLFQRILSKSDFALVHFNEQTKQMTLLSTPHKPLKLFSGSASIGYLRHFSDIRNYFVYGVEVERMFGERGTRASLRAKKEVKGVEYGLEYRKTFGERLDDSMASNKDEVSFFWDFKNLKGSLSRESRENYLSLLRGKDGKEKPFGRKAEDMNSLKHSNLLALSLQSTHSFGNLRCKFGWDYGNRSYFACLGFKLQSTIPLSSKYQLNLSLQGADIHGVNVLKNDLLFRNNSNWPGSRSSNFLSPRAEFMFNEYPFISLGGIKPYLYLQGWGTFSRTGVRVQADYGLGMTAFSNSRFDLSLFKFSGEKAGGLPFGGVKFSF